MAPQDKDRKRLVRERMERTGESYTAALAGMGGHRAPDAAGWPDEVIPVDEPVTDELRQALAASDFHPEVVTRLGVDGPFSAAELTAVARAGFENAARFVTRSLLDGPISPTELADQARRGFESPGEEVTYRESLPDITIEEMSKAAAIGLTPGHIRDYREVRPSMTLMDMMKASTLRLRPTDIAAFQDSEPGITLTQMMSAHVSGLRPEQIGRRPS